MTLTINGKVLETLALNLEMLLEELGYEDALVATALNGDFISHELRDMTSLQPGDKVEILAPMKGG